MSAYLIASYDITDASEHDRYALAADSILQKHGGELLVVDDAATAIEGKSQMINVLIKFDSEADALSFYQDPDYLAIKDIRLKATTNSSVVLTKQLVMPDM